MTLLQLDDVTVNHGALTAISQLSIELPSGSVRAIIGPNGAGKSTLLNTIAGRHATRSGTINLDGESIVGAGPHEIVARGVSLSPQDREVFGPLSVRENLELGAYVHRRDRARAKGRMSEVLDVFPALTAHLASRSDALSGGQQQMLAIGRALMAEPRLLMLDEPSAGLAPIIVDAIFDVVRQLADGGLTLLLAEQNAVRALEVAQYGYVLRGGRVEREGSADQLADGGVLADAYLGTGSEGM